MLPVRLRKDVLLLLSVQSRSFVHACCFGLCLFGVLACCRCILYGHGLEEYRRGRMCGRGGYEMERKPTSLTFGSMAEEN